MFALPIEVKPLADMTAGQLVCCSLDGKTDVLGFVFTAPLAGSSQEEPALLVLNQSDAPPYVFRRRGHTLGGVATPFPRFRVAASPALSFECLNSTIEVDFSLGPPARGTA
jgi:hypothetical protein